MACVEILKRYKEEISKYDKLSISEAQELYKKAMSTSDENLRQLYMDKIILGTLYVVYNYIDNTGVFKYLESKYDIEDIISSFTETWIDRIKSGALLRTDQLSHIYSGKFINDVYDKLGESDFSVSGLFHLKQNEFVEVLSNYIELRNRNGEITQSNLISLLPEDIIKKWCEEIKYYYSASVYDEDLLRRELQEYVVRFFNASIMNLLDRIYRTLDLSNNGETLNKSIIQKYLKMIISAGITEPITEETVEKTSLEDKILSEEMRRRFIEDLDEALKTERKIGVMHKSFGIGNEEAQDHKEIADFYGVSKEAIRVIEAKTIRQLRFVKKLRQYSQEGLE